ncbi:MAG: hypothetical protein O2V44_09480 [Candidatus Bathyarchaeota archaeon]|nr:hypothetical protein [Candidatus Bathyarchaeota archaeon]
MPILTEPMKKYVLSEDKRGWNKSAYNSRIREYAVQGLRDLALLADKLPEEELAKIFNKENLFHLLESILKTKISVKNHEEWKKIKETPIMLAKRRRLLNVCNTILMLIGDYNFTAALVPSDWKPWLGSGYPPIDNLRAILYAHQI